jgi:hypothetical protein
LTARSSRLDRFDQFRDDLPDFFAVLDVRKILIDESLEFRFDIFSGFRGVKMRTICIIL